MGNWITPDNRHIHDNFVPDAITGEWVHIDEAVEDEDGFLVHPRHLEFEIEEHAIESLFDLFASSAETPNQNWVIVHGETPPWEMVYTSE